jgi:hypothetical protein
MGLVAAAGIGAAATLYSVNEQKKSSAAALKAAKVPLPPPTATPADESALYAQKRKRQVAAAADMGGTLLTGPQGVQGPAPGQGKTLLGT